MIVPRDLGYPRDEVPESWTFMKQRDFITPPVLASSGMPDPWSMTLRVLPFFADKVTESRSELRERFLLMAARWGGMRDPGSLTGPRTTFRYPILAMEKT